MRLKYPEFARTSKQIRERYEILLQLIDGTIISTLPSIIIHGTIKNK